jgi:hypothetical protein
MEQYTENLQNDLSAFGNPFQRLINATLSLPQDASYLEVLNVTNKIHNTFQPVTCVDWDPYYEAVDPYQYLHCTYLPQLNGYTANSSIWGLNSPSLFLNSSNGDQFLLGPWCKAAFNISSVQGGPAYQASLGLDTNTPQKTSRLLLTGGLLDPVPPQELRRGMPVSLRWKIHGCIWFKVPVILLISLWRSRLIMMG